MTENEWTTCTDPTPMLKLLRDKATDRKLRLFSVGCCRAIWPLLVEKSPSRQLGSKPFLLDHERRIIQGAEPFLDVADQYENGRAGSDKIGTAYCALLGLLSMRRPRQEPWAYTLVALLRAVSAGGYFYGREWEYQTYDPVQCAKDAGDYVAKVAGWIGKTDAAHEAMRENEATLIRCIFGPMLFRSVPLNPHWLTWKDSTVPKVAQAIYDDCAFDRLPILVDALEEAGCMDANILGHCRQRGPHVRGCWVIDLLLGKERKASGWNDWASRYSST